ncbi:thioredoxin-like 1-1, chloroplastic [Beta vulgaris subsp. vulgaris]|uniref:thioredoxin-like 1-1, chloroplastic n=1 Tax=Beta vulgaris subsp. vulgaris TaxID=3555 RepID=UPI0020372981|nr:thioredoxin-like 1-1, chloroplastic [Beta vulgaris subsp. vulgaris]
MADVLTKSSVFSPTISHHHSGSKNFPIKCSVSVSNRGRLVGISSLRSSFGGVRIAIDNNTSFGSKRRNYQSIDAKMGLSIGKAQKWWEKGLQPNMREITSAEDLVDSLLTAGDTLVVVDFFSPGCGGCRALHPKLCQLAEMNPDVQFLQINYEEHKSMCYSLNVHVLPFFRFYRGAEGRVSSFSCTNATIKKFKDALAKHNPARCSLGPTKGLEEKELLALAANKDLSFTYTPKPVEAEPVPAPALEEVSVKADEQVLAQEALPSSNRKPLSSQPSTVSEEKTLATAAR